MHVQKCWHAHLSCNQHSPPLVQPLVMMTFVLQCGWCPLHAASDKGYLDIVKTLIEAGANVNQVTKVQCVGRLLVTHYNI